MKTLNYTIVDHLQDDFETQTLLERKRRVDLQIDEHLKLFSLEDLSEQSESIITNTLHNLLIMQRAISSQIKFLRAICLN